MAVVGRKLEPLDIVDGHRQKTLQLLWTLIFIFKVSAIMDLFLSIVIIMIIKLV